MILIIDLLGEGSNECRHQISGFRVELKFSVKRRRTLAVSNQGFHNMRVKCQAVVEFSMASNIRHEV
jgi:hypothetical protein